MVKLYQIGSICAGGPSTAFCLAVRSTELPKGMLYFGPLAGVRLESTASPPSLCGSRCMRT
ncbi:hypothetical protein D3C76_623660 [compost metagenome]